MKDELSDNFEELGIQKKPRANKKVQNSDVYGEDESSQEIIPARRKKLRSKKRAL